MPQPSTCRIEADTVEPDAKQWRLDHLAAYEAARVWLDQDAEIVDTTDIRAVRVAELIAGRAPSPRAER